MFWTSSVAQVHFVSPVHVVFDVSPPGLRRFILLRGHVDHGALHLCRLWPWTFTHRQLPPLCQTKVCNLERGRGNEELIPASKVKNYSSRFHFSSHSSIVAIFWAFSLESFTANRLHNSYASVPLSHVQLSIPSREIPHPAECSASSGRDVTEVESCCGGSSPPGRSRRESSDAKARRERGTAPSVGGRRTKSKPEFLLLLLCRNAQQYKKKQ